jgi:hypothetical protein
VYEIQLGGLDFTAFVVYFTTEYLTPYTMPNGRMTEENIGSLRDIGF